ncbi:hypothetical protein DDZ14_07575 [Maritimibacter sp. 55A14]|uniref:glycosyltransferase family 87 protein n=1 Tax=Maritimibacter sp. 55A14 TaxID=2174844 RepID=UPI000D61D042|nr:glycosyltransferase family 87 protein [Maritimibacter sp. 55A14]PWE32942.1 hypothetical protein DDZ14_07575 [Maritimibacter sp. 55A14]
MTVAIFPALLRAFGCLCMMAILGATIYAILDHRGLGLDFANFYDAGRKAWHGELNTLYDPMASIDGQPPFGNMLFFSAPVSSYLFAPFGILEPIPAALSFMTLGAVCMFCGLGLLYYRNRPPHWETPYKKAEFFALFFAAAMMFQPFWTVFQVGGQTTPAVFLMFVLALIAFERDRFGLTALLYTAIVLIKPVFAPGACLLFLFAPWPFRFWSLAIGLTAICFSVLVAGWQVNLDFLNLMRERAGAILGIPYFNSHMFAWIEPMAITPSEYNVGALPSERLQLVSLLLRFAIVGWIVALMWRLSRIEAAPHAQRGMAILLSVLAALAFSPVVWSHYLMIFFIPLAHFLARHDRFPRTVVALVALAILAAPLQNFLILKQVVEALMPLSQGDLIFLTSAKSIVMLALMAAILFWPSAALESFRTPVRR